MYDASFFAVVAALLGLIVGSFLNALSFRFNTGKSILHGRSACMRCGHTLHALDLIPLVSYLLLGGKCRYCGTKISLQYPAVEAIAALLGYGVYMTTPEPLSFAFWFVVWMVLLFIVIYDLRHTIIPWSCSFLLLFLSIISLFLFGTPTPSMLLAGPALALPLLLLSLFSGGTWMGWGDGALELSLGWLLGLLPGLTALALGIWSGAIVGILLVVYSQLPALKAKVGFTMKSELPFAPFLALGASLVYFFHVDLFSSLTSLWH
jgi:prepilin signal peptidase PulO-like enzyme (type II secretory pathway)